MAFWDDLWSPILDYRFEGPDVAVFFTLILLEGVLSFDNAAVLAVMVRRLPANQQRKALLYGLVGAYTFRVAAILLAAFLIANPYLRIVGGLYLLYLFGSHFARQSRGSPTHAIRGFPGISPFWSTVIMVELADIVFALDQIVAAVALTDKYPVIIAAALVAILALRLSAVYMIRLMNWFPTLEHLAYLAVGWVGAKLVTEDTARLLGHEFHVPKVVSVLVTLFILVVPVVFKLAGDMVRRRRPRRAAPPPPVAAQMSEDPWVKKPPR